MIVGLDISFAAGGITRVSRGNRTRLPSAFSTMLLALLFLIISVVVRAGTPVPDFSFPRDTSLDRDWKFYREDTTPIPIENIASLDDSGWKNVDLPDCAVVEKFEASHQFQGICWYRKTFRPTSIMKGKRVSIEFQAAMQLADVWINGRHRLTHEGGYLPFTVDISDDVVGSEPVVVTLRLDNRDDPDIPPGRPLKTLDFCYFSGLYRNAILHITDPLHITDAVQADRVAGGGIFIRYPSVSDALAKMDVAVDIRNDGAAPRAASLVSTLIDATGKIVQQEASPETNFSPGASLSIARALSVNQPHLWSPNDPYLYILDEKIMSVNGAVDEVRQRIGIRTLRTDPKLGFFLNGKHLVPDGANRHQAYPYLGNALSDAAQYRDARKLKDAGFELIRLCHYPQSPAFLDACDELGLMTIICIPGWQHFSDTDRFKNNVMQNLRDTIRRDRNHACAVLWETSLNETGGHDDFFHGLVQIAHQEYPGDQILACGDVEGHNPDVIGYDVPYSGWDGATHTRPSRDHGAMSLHREYGDNQFGGFSRVARADGEGAMLVQAWNYQTALNQQMELPYTWGQCIWEAIDNNHGTEPNIATCGALDLFRLEKFMYYFYQSQRNPAVESPLYSSGPMVYIANYWTAQSPRDVTVFSNAEEVELLVNGQSMGRRKPDSGPDVPFGDNSGFDLNYWQSNSGIPSERTEGHAGSSGIFNGGNCSHLAHAPFTFGHVAFQPGELKAVAFIGGSPVAEAVRRTPGPPNQLQLSADLSGKDWMADGADAIFIHAEVEDKDKQPCPDSDAPLKFSVAGPARIIGPDSVKAEAGVGTILVQALDDRGKVTISASSSGLPGASISLETKAAMNGF